MTEITIHHSRAKFSKNGTMRWQLLRVWRSGPPALWIMCNPSTADAIKSDPTIDRCIVFTENFGYHAMLVMNIFPWVSSKPQMIRKKLQEAKRFVDEPLQDQLRRNREMIIECAKSCPRTIAAWGLDGEYGGFADSLAEEITALGIDIYCMGETKSGAPMHPMARGRHRIPSTEKPYVWRAGADVPTIEGHNYA